MKSEETKEINVTFPEEYQAEELAGQPVVFKVTVHDIKAKVLPEVNDELIKQAEIKDVETVDAYKEYARKNLETSKANAANQKFENEIADSRNGSCRGGNSTGYDRRRNGQPWCVNFAQRLQSQGFGSGAVQAGNWTNR